MTQEPEHAEAWDCNPFHVHTAEEVDSDLDEEDNDNWQQLILDRFHDRLVPSARRV